MKNRRGNLGFGTGLLLLMFSISFALYLFNCTSYSSVFLQLVQGTGASNCALNTGASAGTTGSIGALNNQITNIFTSLGILGAGSVIAYAVGFPNGYAIFAAAAYFMLGAFTMPVGLFAADTVLPLEIRVFIVFVLGMLNLFAVLEYLGAKRF